MFGECIVKYIDILGRKGCNRTAIEFCKLLLSLDPVNDPFGVFLRLDYYAIRGKEYKLLINFVKKITTEIYPEEKMASLLIMPNYLFTVPLAKYFDRGGECLSSMEMHDAFEQVVSLESNNINDLMDAPAESLLFLGAVLYPDLIVQLVNKVGKSQMHMGMKRDDSSGW